MNADQEARALVAEAAVAVDPRIRAQLLARAVAMSTRSVEGALGEELSAAVAGLEPNDDPVCTFVRAAASGILELRGRNPAGAPLVTAARETYERFGLDRQPECLELMVLGTAMLLRPEDVPALVGDRLRAGEVPPEVACRVQGQVGLAEAWTGHLIRGHAALVEARDLAAAVGQSEVEGEATALLAKVAAFRGDLETADALLTQARRAAAASGSDWVAHGIVECAVAVEFVRGDVDAWLGLMELIVSEGGGLDSGLSAEYVLELATARALAGRGDEATRLAGQLGDPPPGVPGAEVMHAWRRWLLAVDDPTAQATLAEAVRSATRASAWVLRARGAWLLADHLVARGRPSEARALVELAARTYASAGAAGMLDAVLSRTALHNPVDSRRLRLVPARGEPELTSAERTVAEALQEGLSNREIAERAHVTVKTVEFHLGNIYRKLGVRGRTELVVRLAGRD